MKKRPTFIALSLLGKLGKVDRIFAGLRHLYNQSTKNSTTRKTRRTHTLEKDKKRGAKVCRMSRTLQGDGIDAYYVGGDKLISDAEMLVWKQRRKGS